MKGLVESKIALVTGGASGIGRAVCELLAEHGATVAIVDNNEIAGKQTVARIQSAGGKSKFYCCDVGDKEQIHLSFHSILGDYGRLDILVNNCGIADPHTIVTLPDENWRRVMTVNLDAMFRLSKLAVTNMLERKYGAIVNISSLGGIVGGPGGVAYCTSKFGVIGLTRSMAADHSKDGIRINCVAPGMTYTDMAKIGFENTGNHDMAKANLEKALPIGRMAQTREIAAGVLFLASDLASYCAGSVLAVDGGVTGCFWPHGS